MVDEKTEEMKKKKRKKIMIKAIIGGLVGMGIFAIRNVLFGTYMLKE